MSFVISCVLTWDSSSERTLEWCYCHGITAGIWCLDQFSRFWSRGIILLPTALYHAKSSVLYRKDRMNEHTTCTKSEIKKHIKGAVTLPIFTRFCCAILLRNFVAQQNCEGMLHLQFIYVTLLAMLRGKCEFSIAHSRKRCFALLMLIDLLAEEESTTKKKSTDMGTLLVKSTTK